MLLGWPRSVRPPPEGWIYGMNTTSSGQGDYHRVGKNAPKRGVVGRCLKTKVLSKGSPKPPPKVLLMTRVLDILLR